MAWLVQQLHAKQHDQPPPPFVLKQLVMTGRDFNAKNLLRNQRETLIMERLTNSPRIVDTYGSCGTSVLVEAMEGDSLWQLAIPHYQHGDDLFKKKQRHWPWLSQHRNNALSTAQRLDLALTTAEAIADMHGFVDGSVFNSDMSLLQFLVQRSNAVMTVKLNDFNSAFIPGWNHTAGAYCRPQRGSWESPVRDLHDI